MKPLSERTHYEVLDLPREVSGADVERAYQVARAAFAEDSLAAYSACPPEEAAVMRERIELAHRVLADPEARRRYDAGLGTAEHAPAEAEPDDFGLDPAHDAPEPRREVEPEITGFDDLEEGDEAPFDGARLRRARLRLGLDIDRIASVTKISPGYLRHIEADEYEDLPANVYVRGFVTAYARCVGLDPERVVPPYMQRVLEARESEQRSRRERV